MKKGIVLLLLVLLVGVYVTLPALLEPKFNRVIDHPPYKISDQAAQLHQKLTIMDWHADTLLWERDLNQSVARGHVDLARLQQGNVAIQMFTTVTKSPSGQNYQKNDGNSDRITLLAVAQGWPVSTWGSLLQRALYQAQKLDDAVQQSNGQLRWIKNQKDLNALLEARGEQGDKPPIGVMLGSEGGHPLEGNISNLDLMYHHGFRMMGLQHFFDNQLGGSLHGISQQGLTAFGRQVVKHLNELSMIIDVAHSSAQVVEDVLAISSRPIVVSHTGLYGVCQTPRNLSDGLMQKIAQKGGLIALGYWDAAVCDISPQGIAKMIQYGINLVGEDHIALGSDFDGAVETQLDTSELAAITQHLVDLGVKETQIQKVMGKNSVNFLQNNLPE
ncbi:dipeptidase [Neptunicella marina]|uniref:Dipeptidase n=1 Tax=Neptunicella marina TaxID=2125989 RepID=A0A8J6M7E6_9ALTE|nr:dipeptidase [Neptunicella marina]MBC3767571.1 dipeptidase [Neptunicella marina]